ncbi:5'/3'-nucleotidase SurE [Nonomuraea sp. M3C6]|uniref:5'-nucleotidase n=1 Tax=Nonomuraea marmarensis TaxID=3351344 RepID=A0ABW7A6P4_9ACTN
MGSPARAQTIAPLRILLTTDDGYNAPLLQQLRKALTKAGHHVTVVAPVDDSSGIGTSINIKFGTTLKAAEMSPGAWAVEGSPVDAVAFGMSTIFQDVRPDLVVSGPNEGENVAALANHSGTVGAAIAALAIGVPSIAVSIAKDGSSLPSAPKAVEFTVRLVNRVAATASNGGLLPPRTALNVNYPAFPAGEVTFARLGTSLPISTSYVPAAEVCATCYRILPVFSTTPDPVAASDRTLLAEGKVTITPLDGSWEADPKVFTLVRNRLGTLTP